MAADVEPVAEAPEMPEGPALLERGRHAITGHTDGSWTINRAGPLCERCQNCGCGAAADPIHIPAFAVSMIQGGPNALPAPLRAMLGKVMGNGRG